MTEAAHIPIRDQNMRGHLRDRERGWAASARELARVAEASAPATPPGGKRYITAEEACADLGLEPDVRAAAEAEIRGLVSEQKNGFEVSQELRKQRLKAPVIRELLARGMRMVAELKAQRTVSDLFVRKAKPPPGAGWQPIPKGKSGGFRRPKSGGGFEYAYPDKDGGYTSHNEPAADEGLSVHEEHENGTPDPKVAARMTQMQEKAKAAGLDFTGTATSRTTMKHLNELEKQLDKAIAQKRKREAASEKAPPGDGEPVVAQEAVPGKTYSIPRPPGAEGAKPPLGDDDVFATPSPDAKPKPNPKSAEPAGDNAPTEPAGNSALREKAAAKGVASEQLDKLLADPDFQTDEGREALANHLDALPGVAPAAELPDEPPAERGERKKLEDHAAGLDDVVARLEKVLAVEREKHAAEMKELRAEIAKLKANPSPRHTVEATHGVWTFALLTLGAVVGGLFAGPVGAMLGSSMASQYMRTGVLKSQRRPPGLYVVGDRLVLVKADDHHERVGRENRPESVSRRKADIVRELADATGEPSSLADVVQTLEAQSPTWRDVSPWLSPENRRKLIVAASAVLHSRAATPVPERVAPAEPDPAPPVKRARRDGENEYGHRDGLVPGQKLPLAKGRLVEVLAEGAFRLDGQAFADSRALLKALGAAPRATIRQVFRLTQNDARLAKSVADRLRAKHPALLTTAVQGWVRVEGDLAGYSLPSADPLDTVAVYDPAELASLLLETP